MGQVNGRRAHDADRSAPQQSSTFKALKRRLGTAISMLALIAAAPAIATQSAAAPLDLHGYFPGDQSWDSNGDPVTQSSSLTVGGITNINAGSGAITLSDAGNDFQGAVSLTGGTVQIRDANALTFGNLDTMSLTAISVGLLNLGSGSIDGVLDVTSNGGTVTQSDALRVSGTTDINAGAGDITLTHTGNDFIGPVTLTGNSIRVFSKNDLTIGALVSGANADVTLRAGGVLALPAVGINTGSGNLTLSSDGGVLATNGALKGNGIDMNGRDGLLLGNDITATGSRGLSLSTTNAHITQTAGALLVAGRTDINAGTGAVTLTNVGNGFAGTVSVIGGTVHIRDANALMFGYLAAGALTAESTGALNLGLGSIDGMLDVTSNGGAVGQSGALAVGGTTDIDADGNTIALTNTGNDFMGAMSLSGGSVYIHDINALTFGNLDVVSLAARSTGALHLGSGSISGTLDVASNGGAVTQGGSLMVDGGAFINAGTGAITLDNAGNDFMGVVSFTGGTVHIRDANALMFGHLAAGALTAESTGALNLGLVRSMEYSTLPATVGRSPKAALCRSAEQPISMLALAILH